jgi:hypothetical protein
MTQHISIELDVDQSHFVLRIPNCVCFTTADGLESFLGQGWRGGNQDLELTRTLDFGETMPSETYYCYERDVVNVLQEASSQPPPPDSTLGVIDAGSMSSDEDAGGVTP